MTMFRCGGGTGLDICQPIGTIDVGSSTSSKQFTFTNIRPGKRLLFWLKNGRITVTDLTLTISDALAEIIFNNEIVDGCGFALIKPKTSTLSGTVRALFDGSWGSGVDVFEVPDDLKGIMKFFTGNGVLQDLSDLGTPPFHFIGSQLSSVAEPLESIQRNGYLNGRMQEFYCKLSYFTPTWQSSASDGQWILY